MNKTFIPYPQEKKQGFHITTEQKAIGAIALISIAILFGAVFLLTKDTIPTASVPKENIITDTGLHWHPKVTITIKGKKQEIPANLGLGAVHQKIHTHDKDAKDGIVHLEAQGVVTKDDTKLGNFFRVWGKEFSSAQIFDKKNGAEGIVKMTVNNAETDAFENYLMKDGDIIEIRYE